MKFDSIFNKLLYAAGVCAVVIAAILVTVLCAEPDEGNITGVVYADGKPLPGVRVSDGVEIVVTDRKGRYGIESDKH